MRVHAYLVAFVMGLAFLAGCGRPGMAPVKGRVMCNSKPVEGAVVTFNPVPKDEKDREPGKPGTGVTDAEGYYEISTYRANDGALIGPHRVWVNLDDRNPAPCPRDNTFELEVKPGDNELNIELPKTKTR